MKTKATTKLIGSSILFVFLFLAGVTLSHAAPAPSGVITKKIIIVVPSEPDTLDLNSTKMPGVSALVLLKNIRPASQN